MPSTVTVVPARAASRVPWEFTVKATPVVGPSRVPKMVAMVPGENPLVA